MQIAVHAIGDRAVNQVVTCYERFLAGNPLRHRIEHVELLDAELIARIARLGLVLGVQPAFEHYWGGPGGCMNNGWVIATFSLTPIVVCSMPACQSPVGLMPR